MSDFAARLPLIRTGIDRDDLGRPISGELLEHPDTRVLLQRRDTVLVRERDDALAVDLRTTQHLPPFTAPLYLGKLVAERVNPDGRIDPAGTSIVAIAVEDFDASEVEPDANRWPMLYESAGMLDDTDGSLFTQALAIRNFHRSHQYSPANGEKLTSTHGGWVLQPEGGQPVFPRVDPAVIVGVVDPVRDRILLGANVNWAPRRYSAFAGFVEPGESFESAAVRELLEEARVHIVNPRYLGSQPWPMPASIMIGFLAEIDPTQDPDSVQADGNEIAEVRWFTREELAENVDLLPGTVSIARAIIEEWYGGPLR